MLAFPVIAFAIALIAIGRGGSRQFIDERRRDQIARQVCFFLGIIILVIFLGSIFL